VLDPVPAELWRNMAPISGTRVGFCEECGFYHVDPYPQPNILAEYYSTYEMPTPQANLAETARLLARNIGMNDVVLDIGCGDGGFLKEMHKLGFKRLVGFDQSPGIERAQSLGFGTFYRSSVWEFLEQAEKQGGTEATAVVMVNVLEHVSDPLDLLTRVHRVLPENGAVCVTVPNDFSPLQQAFLKAKGHLPWFVCLPDHLNYFDFVTLAATLQKTGFTVTDQSALYPLELFLLQDLDYIADPSLGPVAHNRRVTFETNMKAAGMTDTLDHFYRTLAAGGYGRDAMMVARKT
jgi:2-polyprenyl-3-methyl-5-hydroxy-6-metoxy-1,4-benzoquinol methylase